MDGARERQFAEGKKPLLKERLLLGAVVAGVLITGAYVVILEYGGSMTLGIDAVAMIATGLIAVFLYFKVEAWLYQKVGECNLKLFGGNKSKKKGEWY